MIRTALFAVALSLFGCKKEGADKAAPPAPAVAPSKPATVAADGVRTVPIEANNDGYTPGSIPGKPGEKLNLVFTRTADSSCISELKAPDGTIHKLPMNEPVTIAVTVPTTGQVEFACGMGMFHGTVVAQPST